MNSVTHVTFAINNLKQYVSFILQLTIFIEKKSVMLLVKQKLIKIY